MRTILVTGGCGFIFSNFIRYMLKKYPDYRIINLDALKYAGRLENTEDFKDNKWYKFVKGDVCDETVVNKVMEGVDWVVHAAAESHVDRSIGNPSDFLQTNIFGTYNLLEAAKKHNIEKFLYVGTDEAYGSIEQGEFMETSNLAPNSPYSVSKTSADLLTRSYWKTFDLPVLITRGSNTYGPWQYPEKLISLFVTNLLEGKKVPLYGKGINVRDWIYVLDHCSGVDFVLHNGKIGEAYNVGGGNEKTNIEITEIILKELGKDESWIEYVKDRPGHDFRYALDCSKIRALGWRPEYDFNKAIKKTVEWYKNNQDWWKRIKTGEYLEYYKKQYN
jgi:dTDP-glucose 4,6-dehydratase